MNSYCNPEISYDAAENAELEATYYGAFKKYGMPYLDHCYATGLPMAQFDSHPNTPPLPLTEPLAAFVDIEEVGVRGGSHGMPSTHSTGKRSGGNSSSAKNSGHNNSSSTNTVISNNGGGDTEVDPYEGSVTRCICDFQHDDGYMICCDRCGVWQHVECMGVDGKHIPDSYLCELCYPRLVDKRRAVRIQSKKKEELEMEESSGSADDSLEEESTRRPKRRGGRRRDQGRRKTAERSESGGGQRKSQQRRKRTSSEMEGKKHSDGMHSSSNKEQKRLRPQSFTGYERSDAWDGNSPTEREADARQFGTGAGGGPSPIQPNTYSSEVLNLLVMKVKTMGASNSSNVMAITQQLSRKCFKVVSYEDNSKGLEAIEMIKPNHTVAEYTGKTVMRREYERNQSDLSYPFTVCYMGINGVELCVDSNDFNNEAKFVRRSCTPNAKVVHLLEKTGLRFFICATKTIPSGKEITIPFYFDYQRSTVELKCPCGKFNCMVAKHFKRMAGARSSIATVATTTTAAMATAVLPAAAATAQQRPVRQSKKRALDEFADGADDEEDKDDDDPDPVIDRCPTGALGSQSPTKRRNLGDIQPSEQQECRTSTPGRTVKSGRGRVASQTGSNGSEKGSFLASMLQAHLARNSNLSKASLAPMGANISDDIALLNKLSSVGALHLASARIDQSEASDANRGKSKDSGDDEQQPSLADRAVESDQPSKRKQQLPQTKETKIESETKEAADQASDGADMVDTKMVPEEHQQEEGGGDKPAPKERRKNSKLLAEIQTFFRTEGSEDNKDSGDKKVSTREQRKIEAAERRFEKIEKSSARLSSRAMSSTSSTNQKQIKTRSGQQDGKTKKDEEASQRSSPKGVPSKATKPIMVRNVSGKPQKTDDSKIPTRQQPDKKQTAADVKKSTKVTAAPSRMTRSSRK